jgi:diadenosine tetraphosphatase ApaH/serine/threonine PP2A family protein phosphatase
VHRSAAEPEAALRGGNHDLAAAGKLGIDEFTPDARISCQWTAGQLTARDILYLEDLPLTVETGDFTLLHGSPRQPLREYLFSTSVAAENFPYFKTPYCLAGHTHKPVVYSHDGKEGCRAGAFQPSVKLVLGRPRLIINPGSVGQPRDGNPEASYAVFDDEAGVFTNRRVPYDILATQDKMMARGLPVGLVARLGRGV